jgi:ACS family glucarate transporter-like MFS transporter
MKLVTEQVTHANVPPTRVAPTHVRWNVVAMMAVITGLTYIDRLNLQIAGKYIQDEYKFDTQTMGWVLGAFALGYAIFHVPGGWLGDRFGARSVLALTVLWSSVFTALTAVAPSLGAAIGLGAAWSFAVMRFALGSGEAAAFPVCNKTVGYWLGQKERALGTSLFLTGVGVSGTIAPVAINWIAKRWEWRMSFVICGGLGVVVSAAWYAYVRNRPEEHHGVNAAELEQILGPGKKEGSAVPAKKVRITGAAWGKILKSRSVRALMFSHFCLVYAVNIFFSWFFIYLVRVRGLPASRASLWTSVPFLATMFMVPFWGWLADRISEKLGKRSGRQCAVWLGVGLSAVFLIMGSHTPNNTLAALQLAAAAGFNLAASAILWTACSDITREFAGSVSGAMTTFGSLGGWLSPVVTAKIATSFGWTYALDFAALMTVTGGLAWFIIDVTQSVE